MPEAPRLPDESARLEALRRLGVLDTPAEERLDRITRLAAALFDAPIALVSLVDEERQWFKSCIGLPVSETDRSLSFCAHAILGEDTFVIPDAAGDARFAGNALVTGEPFIRFYAGEPLRAATGEKLGTLCVIDRRPRRPDGWQLARLRDLARMAEHELNHVDLRLAYDRLVAVLRAATGHSIIGTDPDGVIRIFNPGAERMLGYRAEEMVGRSTPVMFHDPDEVAARAAELGVEAGFAVFAEGPLAGDEETREWTFLRRDGKRLTASLTVTAMRGRDGRLEGFIGVGTDITEQRRAEESLRASEERFRALVQHASDGVVLLDATGAIRYASPAALRMVGTHDPAVGSSVFEVIHPEDVAAAAEAFSAAAGSPGPAGPLEIRVRRRGGSYRWVEVVANSLLDLPSVAGIVANVRDVTERHELQRLKDEIVATVSHELRTPLTTLSASLGLLAGGALGDLSDQARRLVDIAVGNADRLGRLINDILDLARIESGAPLERKLCTVADLFDQAVAATAGPAAAAEVTLARAPIPDLEVEADGDRLVQVLTNLIGNAVKFSPSGASVVLDAQRRDEELFVSVADSGRGIPPDQQLRIFERFEQVDASDARDKSGTGLGLAIARGIVTRHGGRIGVESVPGEGSTFWFTVPLHGTGVSTSA